VQAKNSGAHFAGEKGGWKRPRGRVRRGAQRRFSEVPHEERQRISRRGKHISIKGKPGLNDAEGLALPTAAKKQWGPYPFERDWCGSEGVKKTSQKKLATRSSWRKGLRDENEGRRPGQTRGTFI